MLELLDLTKECCWETIFRALFSSDKNDWVKLVSIEVLYPQRKIALKLKKF